MTEEEIKKIIEAAGKEWSYGRGDMNSYLRIIIRITEEKIRADCAKEKKP